MTYRLLDLFCGQGGAGMGYHRAGFEVVGVDLNPQPRYPFEFHQADALEYLAEHWQEFDAIHASPPCQRYSLGTQRWNPEDQPDLLPATETALVNTGKPFVIENVERAPFRLPTFTLCGIQFGLNVIRHRRFAVSHPVFGMPHLIDHPQRGEFVTCAGHGGNGSNRYSDWCQAMGIEWMNQDGMSQAIPPVYTEHIGRQLINVLDVLTVDEPYILILDAA